MPRRNVAVILIIALNVAVFFMWSYFSESFMENEFTISWLGLSQGRIWTLLTSEFSHNFLWHLVINMAVLNSFGSLLERVLGHMRFIVLYLWAAIIASLGHAFVSALIVGEPAMGAVGASGAIAGLVIVFALMFPKEKLLLFFFIPFPVKYGVIIFVALDIIGVIAQTIGEGLPIGHGAHLGGALAGAIFYFVVIRKRWQQIRGP